MILLRESGKKNFIIMLLKIVCLTYKLIKTLVEGLHLPDCGDGHYLDHWSSGDRS
jgi:hypothetical protein